MSGIAGLGGYSLAKASWPTGGYCGADGRYYHPDGTVTGPMSMPRPLSPDHQRISDMIRNGGGPCRGIPEAAFTEVAAALGIEVAVLKAIAKVEAGWQGAFDKKGRPTILFERHYFHDLTAGKHDATHPDISAPKRGGYKGAQYEKMEQAFALDPVAALKSASWGKFQIMGKNFKEAGFRSETEMVLAFMESEVSHLKAVAAFIRSDPRKLKALKEKDWATFARRYNGPAYSDNQYDQKMKAEYEKLKALEKPKAAVPLPPIKPPVIQPPA